MSEPRGTGCSSTSNQAVVLDSRNEEAEWDMERSQSGVRGQAFPPRWLLFQLGWRQGSGGVWGRSPRRTTGCWQGRRGREKGGLSRTDAVRASSDSDLRDRQSIYDSQGGDPGAYTPYTHIEIAAEAAFTFNAIGREQTGARAERTHQPTAQGGSQRRCRRQQQQHRDCRPSRVAPVVAVQIQFHAAPRGGEQRRAADCDLLSRAHGRSP